MSGFQLPYGQHGSAEDFETYRARPKVERLARQRKSRVVTIRADIELPEGHRSVMLPTLDGRVDLYVIPEWPHYLLTSSGVVYRHHGFLRKIEPPR